MTRITNADHVLLLLRNHLERSQRGGRKRSHGKADASAVHKSPLERLEQLAATDDLPEAEIERALVSGLLAEELGEGIVNDTQFQRLVDDVVGVLKRDEAANALLKAALAQVTGRAP